MTSYTITHSVSGRDFGAYEGKTREHALAAMLRDAGIRATVNADGAIALDPRDIDADGEHLAGDLDGYSVEEDTSVECAYCGRTHTPPTAVPALDDDDAWADMAPDHADYCEWIRTRAHRVEIVRVFQGDHESSDDGWANDAYAILRDSGVWVREGVDGCCSWEECSGYQNGVEYVTMRVDSRAAARPALVEHGFVVRADTAE